MRIVGLMVGLAMLSPVARDDTSRRDGNWWVMRSDSSKANYMIGFYDGIKLGGEFSYWNFTKDDAEFKKISDAYQEYEDKYIANITAREVVDGLNVFYKDSRNRRILVNDAVWLVLGQIAGDPDMDRTIENWRRTAH
jgi:hypothetical protein